MIRTQLTIAYASILILPFHLHADSLQIARDATSRRVIDVGWSDDCESDRGWLAEPWQTAKPCDKPVAQFGSDGARFQINSPGTMMAWTRTVNPIWPEAFPVLQIEYTCDGEFKKDYPQLLLFDDSTGPITPNALNTENPLAGQHEAFISLDPREKSKTIDLRKVYPSDRVARIGVRLAAESNSAGITIRRLAFCASQKVAPATQPKAAGALVSGEPVGQVSEWTPVELNGERAVCAVDLARGLGYTPEWSGPARLRVGGIDFQLADAERAALATGVMEEQSIRIAGKWQGSQLGLLVASRVFGNAAPWYAPTSVRMRKAIESPRQVVVRVEYDDGTVDSHFPRPVQNKDGGIERLPAAYVVPLDSSKQLVAFSIDDHMSYGQVFLLAASVGKTKPVTAADTPNACVSKQIVDKPTTWTVSGNKLAIENAWIRMVCDLSSGPIIQSLSLVPLNRQVVDEGSGSALFQVCDEKGKPITGQLLDVKGANVADGVEIRMTWAIGSPDEKHTADLVLAVRDDGSVEIRPTLGNLAGREWAGIVKAPAITAANISMQAKDNCYVVGTCNTTLGSEDVNIESSYGGPAPLPLIDLYAEKDGGGLGFFTVDPEAFVKTLTFKQSAGKADAAIRFDTLAVAPKAKLELPTVTLLPHVGDWHDLFTAYRDRARSKFGSGLCVAGSPLADAFYCRRDYPLGGTNYLFNAADRVYTGHELVAEASRTIGGLGMIDISGWAYNEKTGRVGDYLTNDLGGLDALAKMVADAHKDKVPVGLYFEGYLIDRRCELAKKAMPEWQLIKKDGKPMWWSGEMECFLCPAVKAWQDELAGMIAAVAKKTGADAVYVDEFGYSIPGKACWSPNHGHAVPSNPLREERSMLQAIRKRLAVESPKTAVYIEFAPADALMGVTEACFDIGLSQQGAGPHPTKMPLYRYAFPGLASFQMVSNGIRPVPFEVDDLECAVFHGMGLWLKGRPESWFTADFRDLATRAHGMFAQYGEVFRSADCEPFVPTLQRGLYANRFSSGGKTIYTFFNASGSTIRGPLLRGAGKPVAKLTNLLSKEPVKLESEQTITGTVEPGCVTAILCE